MAGRLGVLGVALGFILGLAVGLLAGGNPSGQRSLASEAPPHQSITLRRVPTATLPPRPTATPMPPPPTPVPPTPEPEPPPPPAAPPPAVAPPAPVVAAEVRQEAPVGYADPALAQSLLALVNAERRNAGVSLLASSGPLESAAQAYAGALAGAGYLTHGVPGQATLADRAQQAGYVGWRGLAENLAQGPSSPEAVIAMWLASPPHRENMLNPAYTEAGVGYYFLSTTGDFWVLVLGSR